jgi:hypothetical protein
MGRSANGRLHFIHRHLVIPPITQRSRPQRFVRNHLPRNLVHVTPTRSTRAQRQTLVNAAHGNRDTDSLRSLNSPPFSKYMQNAFAIRRRHTTLSSGTAVNPSLDAAGHRVVITLRCRRPFACFGSLVAQLQRRETHVAVGARSSSTHNVL